MDNIPCGACRDELQEIEPREWDITAASMRRTGDLGLCHAHTEMLGHGLYRMLKAGGFIVEEE